MGAVFLVLAHPAPLLKELSLITGASSVAASSPSLPDYPFFD
jgi:hypothetical protein